MFLRNSVVLEVEVNSETGKGRVIYNRDVINSTKILEHPIFIMYPTGILSDGVFEFTIQG